MHETVCTGCWLLLISRINQTIMFGRNNSKWRLRKDPTCIFFQEVSFNFMNFGGLQFLHLLIQQSVWPWLGGYSTMSYPLYSFWYYTKQLIDNFNKFRQLIIAFWANVVTFLFILLSPLPFLATDCCPRLSSCT